VRDSTLFIVTEVRGFDLVPLLLDSIEMRLLWFLLDACLIGFMALPRTLFRLGFGTLSFRDRSLGSYAFAKA
jgi:hypothetical protein